MDVRICLLSWGAMIYNLHGSSGFHSLKKSATSRVGHYLRQKLKILRRSTFPTRTSEMLECAQYSK